MLKSTYKPSAAAAAADAPLPPGWTEHTAPTGHKYYYNSETKVSTYTRPGVALEPQHEAQQQQSYQQYGNIPSLADPKVANAYLAQFNRAPQQHRGPGQHGRGGSETRPRPQPVDKPTRKEAIPGCEPWILVYTKYSRRFVYNPTKNASYWRIPEKLMPAILEMDKARIQKKTEKENKESADKDGGESEYEEVEVTDDEAQENEDDSQHPNKRQRTEAGAGDREEEEEEEKEEVEVEEEADEGPVEFTEDDIAMQLQMMGDEYGLEPGDYDDGNMQEWPEGAEGLEFSQEDAELLFTDMLNDFNINPYSPWEKLLEEGKILEDPRYTSLSTTKARKECWDKWTRVRIAELKAERALQEKKDPKVGYIAFLQEKATPKLYWPEFKRKYKKEDAMKDMKLPDKDKEKIYREHINRLKMPQSTLKSDLTALLKAQPINLLNKNTSPTSGLPSQVLGDVRYISLAPSVRDPLIEAFIQGLPPAPQDAAAVEENEEKRKALQAREKREKALEEHNRMVDEQKRKRGRDIAASKARLREGERELDVAMRVGKRGLQGQLAGMKETEDKGAEE